MTNRVSDQVDIILKHLLVGKLAPQLRCREDWSTRTRQVLAEYWREGVRGKGKGEMVGGIME